MLLLNPFDEEMPSELNVLLIVAFVFAARH
jgi:hypothetical protein